MNIPYGKQHITEEDLAEVSRVLQSDFLTQGPELARFEEAFARRINAPYAVAVANGTAALHLCAMALGVKPGTRVITTPITFAASSNCIAYCGGTTEFCDIDPDTFLMDLDALESMLKAQPKGYYSGVIPVAFAGLMVDMKRLRALADEYGLWIIEDACHAPGAYFTDESGENHFAGQGDLAECSIFSFHPVKHIACGEGGMITTGSQEIFKNLNLLRTHGITKDPDLLEKNDGPWYYEMVELGYNYRLTDFQAALGRTQLGRLDQSLEKRNAIADYYREQLAGTGLGFQKVPEGFYHAYHLFVVLSDQRKELYQYLRENGIFAQVHYIPVHLMPFYRKKGWNAGDLPNAEAYYDKCLSIPMYPSISDEELQYVVKTIRDFQAGT